MTTGSITKGVAINQEGYGLIKSWSGTDYPKGILSTDRAKLGYDSIRMWVYRGEQRIKVTHRYSMPPANRRPSPRLTYAEHPYNMTLTEQDRKRFRYSVNSGATWFLTGVSNVSGSSWAPSAQQKSELALQVLGQLREKVAGSSFNAGVFLGEGKEALSTIADSATRLYGAYHAAKRGNLHLAAQKLVGGTPREHLYSRKHAANNWLQLQYGWLPLLKDAHDGAQFLAHYLNAPSQQVYRVRGRIAYNMAGFDLFKVSGATNWASATGWYRHALKATLKEKDVVALSGLTDPLSVAWELLPYSFVIDWFIPIGNYLQARGLKQALTGTFVETTSNTWETRGLRYNKANWLPSDRYEFGPAVNSRFLTKSLNRTVKTTLTVPLPDFKSLASVPSWKRALNATALLLQLKS